MTTSRIFTAVRSTLTTTGVLPTLHNTKPATRYCVIRASTYFSSANENRRILFIPHDAKGSWGFTALLAAAATAVTASIASMIMLQHEKQIPTLCEQCVADSDEDDDDDEDFRDPMSSYALSAIIREMKSQHDQQQQMEQPHGEMKVDNGKDDAIAITIAKTPSASVQATSSSAVNDPLPLNPSDAILEGSVPILSEAEARIEEATRKAKQHSGGLKIFSGNGNMSLALEICRHLGVNLGKATVGRFADGEVNVVIHENVRGKDVYIVQPTCPPVNDNIMELLLMVSTLRRSSARRITVVIPYYGYARQDRKMQVAYDKYSTGIHFDIYLSKLPSSQLYYIFYVFFLNHLKLQARVPISAADVARLMESMGIDRVIAVDLHCGQIQGFFGPRVPVDNLDGGIVGLDYFGCKDLHNPVIVSPDAGGVYRAKKFKEGLEHKHDMQDLGLAMIVKQRARAGSVDQMDLVGDVKDCDCIIVDDMIDTAGTLCKASDVLIANGARRVFAFASHGLLSGQGNERIANSSLSEVVILNTIPTSPQREANEKLTELSVASLLAQAIFNIHAKKSISALFK